MNETRPSVAIIGTRGYPSYYGGFETAVRKLAPYLVDSGWDVTVYGRPGQTRSEEADPRVRTVITGGLESRSLSTLSFGLTASLHALREKPDAALIMNVANGFFIPLLRARGIPTLVNVDGIEWERDKWGRLAKALFRSGALFTARSATKLVFDAHAIGDYWKRVFHRDGLFIPYGGEDKDPAPAPMDLTPQGYALLVARFVPENSVGEFLDAAAQLADEIDVVIVGSTGYGGELDERAAALDAAHERVTWLGHVSDDPLLFSLWQNAGVYFHGHTVGGTNPALVQAMNLGCAVVARDTVYNREVLDDAGVFVGPDATQIAEAIRTLMHAPEARRELASKAKKRAQQIYTWDKVCSAYDDALRSILK